MALVRPSTTWRRVAYGTTSSTGYVTLRAKLPATSALRLRHPVGAVLASSVVVRSVSVATRVTASPSASRIKLGTTLAVRGSIGPAHRVGSVVQLQRYVSGAWRNVASGRMTTRTSYSIRWRPTGVNTYRMRVVKPADTNHRLGRSASWRQSIVPETAADVARAILANGRISLDEVHESGVRDLATAQWNVSDLAAGHPARRSSYGTAPGGWTWVDLRLLRAVRRMGQLGSVSITEVVGGSHAPRSKHYAGRAVDINWVNGRHVAPGSAYGMAVNVCRAFGAGVVYSPSYDPFGGHSNHVHCEWP